MTADLRWHPFQLNPDMPVGGMSRKRYVALKFGGPERGRSIYRNIAGRRPGLPASRSILIASRGLPNTLDSHRLLVLAQRADLQNEVVEALFAAYFLEGRDIGSVDVLDRHRRGGRARARRDRALPS